MTADEYEQYLIKEIAYYGDLSYGCSFIQVLDAALAKYRQIKAAIPRCPVPAGMPCNCTGACMRPPGAGLLPSSFSMVSTKYYPDADREVVTGVLWPDETQGNGIPITGEAGIQHDGDPS